MKKMPALFIPHGGGPCFFMDWSSIGPSDTWNSMEAWLKSVPSRLDEKPKALVVISAHWEESEFTILGSAQPGLLFDYSGFPAHTYELEYPASGEPELARVVQELLDQAGIRAPITTDRNWDHGVFIPLKVAFPNADIPIVQISLKRGLDPESHLALGRALAPLREQGVLIVGSGMSYHNLRGMFSGQEVIQASDEFDSWLTKTVSSKSASERNERLSNWSEAPFARMAHPREEHLIPLLVAAGAAGTDLGQKAFSDRVMGATVSAYQFG